MESVKWGAVVACVSIAAAIFVAVGPGEVLICGIVGGVAVLAVCRAMIPFAERKRVAAWAFLAFAIHAVASPIEWNTPSLQNPDADAYTRIAAQLATGRSVTRELAVGKEGYVHALSWVYSIFGVHIGVAMIFNIVCAALLVPVVYDTAKRMFGPQVALVTLPLTALWPSMAYWTSQVLREAGVLLLIAIAANITVRLRDHWSAPRAVALFVTIGVLSTFRNYMALTVGAGLLIGLVLSRKGLGRRTSRAVVAGLLLVPVIPFATNYSGFDAALNANLETVNTVRENTSQAGSGINAQQSFSSPLSAIAYLPRSLPQTLVGPWKSRGRRRRRSGSSTG